LPFSQNVILPKVNDYSEEKESSKKAIFALGNKQPPGE